MKLKVYCLAILMLIIVKLPFAQVLKMMTYNIRLDVASDAENNWQNRKEAMIDLLMYYHPDICGVQEAMPHQIEYLSEKLDHYKYIGVGRDDGKRKGEFSALLYDTTKYSVSNDTTIWLNQTGTTGEKGWDAAYPRICTYGLFSSNEGDLSVWVFNTHFDHMGDVAREESAKLILETIQKVNTAKLPVILCGDLNLLPETKPIETLRAKLNDTYLFSKKPPYGPIGTFTGFNAEKVVNDKIDYIFVKGFEVESVRHIDDRRQDNNFVSDHLPVFSILNVK